MRISLLLAVLFLPVVTVNAAPVIETDVCVFGGTSGGVVTAVQATRQGKTVSLAVVTNHIGGLTSGGLGATDVGSHGNSYIQGISREFYNRIAAKYNSAAPRFNFEPKVAKSVFEEMLAESGIVPRFQQRLISVVKTGQRITQIVMDDGTIYRAKMFVDATYEGDLLAMAGVSFTVGREAVATYGESLNGIRGSTPSHQFTVNVDPYVTPGNPASGLLPFIQPGNGGTVGAGDSRVQAYNYRLCLTTNAANRLPITAPAGYNEAQYELLGRLIDARLAAGNTLNLASFMNIAAMPNSKTDINNNGAFSTDFIGNSDAYPTASYAQRAVIEQQHRDYIQGFLFYLGNSTRVPATVRSQMLSYGWCADEFTDAGGWGHIYVRESRRMVSDYVMRQQNCQGTETVPDSIGISAYTMDSHNCQRVVQGGFVRNEGDVQSGTPAPFSISYRSIVPRVGECENLLVPWALSSSHIAFGSIRMEPVYMILGQSAGSAAVIAIDDNVPVQQVSYAKLALQLTVDGQRLRWDTSATDGIIVDNSDAASVTVTGDWLTSSATAGYQGGNYLHDQSTAKGTRSVRFTPTIPATGEYDVYVRHTSHANRSTNVPIDVIHAGGTNTFAINQTVDGATWKFLQRATFNAGTSGGVLVRTTGTAEGTFVIADAARFVSTTSIAQHVQIIASDAVTREGAADPARFTVARLSTDTAAPLVVNYTVSGTAQNGVDVATLPGSVTIPAGAATAIIPVQGIGDALAEGTENITLSVTASAGYEPGPVNTATVQLLDRPIDAWRHTTFSPAELANPAVSGDLADHDHDGLQTLAEYAMGTSPHLANGLPIPTRTGGHLTLTYARRKTATDTAIAVEATHDLKDWNTPAQVEQVSVEDAGEFENVTVRIATPMIQDAQAFVRFKVTR